MDVRDVTFWATEARRRAWARQVVVYNAALLPWQDKDSISKTMRGLEAQGVELEMGDRLDELEKMSVDYAAQSRRLAKQRGKPKHKRRRPGKAARVRRK